LHDPRQRRQLRHPIFFGMQDGRLNTRLQTPTQGFKIGNTSIEYYELRMGGVKACGVVIWAISIITSERILAKVVVARREKNYSTHALSTTERKWL
jgi:hypothetical protein